MADIQAGVGPFLGIFLLGHGWQSGRIGTVMTIGAFAGVVMTAPMGAWVDGSRRKRALVAIPALFTVLASLVVLASQSFWLVAVSQVATAIAGAAMMPAITGITLGIVRQRGFAQQNARNQAFNHAGNTAGAVLAGLAGWWFGLPAVFWLSIAFGVATLGSVLAIPRRAIDDEAARGLESDGGAANLGVLFQNQALVVLALALACFHLGNAAMLPLYGLAVVTAKAGDPARLVATTIVVAQAVMVVVSILAPRLATWRSWWFVLLVSFVSLPIRGLVAANVMTSWGIYPVQILDGIGAGLQSVAVPALVARVLAGTGRVNLGQGAIMTVQGIGAALSPALGGWLAERAGFGTAFLVLGALSVGSVVLWLAFARRIRIRSEEPERAGSPRSSTACV